MSKTTDTSAAKPKKTPKKKGPIRWEAIIPFAIVVALTWAYFFFLFDSHLRWGLETGGYHAIGAEVNVGHVETSFWQARLRIRNVQLTDPEKPAFNMLEIGDIRFGMEWDALLRAKILVNEMAVEGIKIGTARKSPGRVKPPDPVLPRAPGEPSAAEKEANKLKKQALEKAQAEYSDNVLGDIASMLSGTSGQDQLQTIEGTLVSKQQLADYQKNLEEKNKAWQARFQSLPKPAEVQALQDRLGKVKTSGFKNPQELADSIKQFEAIFKEADEKAKALQTAGNELNSDLKNFETGLRDIEAQIKKDVAALEARFRLPKLDAKAISRSLFRQYMDPYLAKISRFRSVVQKYAPPNVMKKGSDKPDPSIQPHPRVNGVTYEFGRQNSYPLFWAKKISVSSKAGSEPGAGDLAGLITDVTTHQLLVGKPTVAKFTGNFPNDQIQDVLVQLSLDNTKEASVVAFDFSVGGYPVNGRQVVDSPEVKLAFANATGAVQAKGSLVGLKELSFKLQNQVKQVKYDVAAQNATVQEILQGVFAGIPTVTVDADINGTLPEMAVEIQSNLGYEIQKGFEAQIQRKIDEAKAKIQAYVNEQIGAEKAKIEAEVSKLKNQADTEVKKVQAQIEQQKAQAQAKVDQSKKDFEDQSKAALKKEEDKAKAGLQKEAEKAAEDLKKKLGW